MSLTNNPITMTSAPAFGTIGATLGVYLVNAQSSLTMVKGSSLVITGNSGVLTTDAPSSLLYVLGLTTVHGRSIIAMVSNTLSLVGTAPPTSTVVGVNWVQPTLIFLRSQMLVSSNVLSFQNGAGVAALPA